jgi:dipeptidyl aminopeptidase/acylaminoacyl peptidase
VIDLQRKEMKDTPSRRSFEIDDLFRFEFMTEAQLSPNGKLVVYVIQRCNEKKDVDDSNLWLTNLEKGKTIQLTFGDWTDFSPTWSPDGHTILFLSNREEKTHLYSIDINGGEARKLTHLPQGCAGPLLLSPDGKQIAFHAGPVEPPDLKKPYRLTRSVYRFDGAGYSDVFCKQIHVLNRDSGEARQLTTDAWNHTAVSWSPDNQRILFLASVDPNSIYSSAHLRIIDQDGNIHTVLSNDWGIIQNAVWMNDNRLAFAGVPAGQLYGSKNDLFVINEDGSGLENRTRSLQNVIDGRLHDDMPVPWSLSLPPLLPADDGTEAIINLQQGGEVHLIQVSLNGPEQIRTLASGQRFCFPFNRCGQRLIFGISTLFDPTQLALLDLSTGEERSLTHFNAELLEQIALPELKNYHFKSIDGTEVEGWVMIPPGAAPFPTILHIHGGPHAAFGHSFYFDFLTLVGAGYAVVFVNHRGSTGYGNAFATATHADWGNLDYQDLMYGIDHVIEMGIADPERLGCCGVSGGGNLSCWIVGHTDRFKAAAPENSVTNFTSFYGTADMGPVFALREMGGKPHEVPEIYARCSPITYAHRATTPTLLFVAEQDYRCPAEQSEQFYTVLKANGCIVEMMRFPSSSHNSASLGSLAVRRQHNEALVGWMNRFLIHASPGDKQVE